MKTRDELDRIMHGEKDCALLLIENYLMDELDSASSQQLELHIAGCTSCRDLVKELGALRDAFVKGFEGPVTAKARASTKAAAGKKESAAEKKARTKRNLSTG